MLPITILGGYAVASVLAGTHARIQSAPEKAPPLWLAGLIAAATFVIHGIALYRATVGDDPVGLSLPNTVSLIGWVIAGAALFAVSRPRLCGLAALLLPVAGLCALGTGLGGDAAVGAALDWPMRAHILLSIFAYAILTVAAGLAVSLALQHRSLRNHRPGGFAALLPPLETTERTLFGAIGAGFALLSLAVFSGLIFVDDILGQHLAHKTILSVFAWLVFGMLIFGRWRFGWRGVKAVQWTLAGFGVLLLAYFGSRVVLEIFLGRSWG